MSKNILKEILLKDKSKIEIRKPKVRDIKAVEHIEKVFEKEVALLSNLTGKTIAELDDMDWDEYNPMSEVINDFLLSAGKVQKEESA